MKQRIEESLKKEINPEFLEVINNSAMHRGHAGDDGSGETHFEVRIKSEELNKAGRISAHRKINQILKDEFDKGLHALEIKIQK